MNALQFESLIVNATIAEIGLAYAQGHVTAHQLVQGFLDRIAKHNQAGASINAVRTLAPRALAQAQALDRERAQGQVRGPLHGIPYLVKDNVLTGDGLPASAGARVLADYVPTRSATLVSKLEAAGAILLGKTHMTEFADYVSDVMPGSFSGVGAHVRNPHSHEPYDRGSGSSVGSASSVAASFAVFAIGTETQNSIQTPAVLSSVVGFKPSVGMVSRAGIVPLVPSQDSPGPLTRCVADAATVFEALAGPDASDTATLRHPQAFLASTSAATPRSYRIGVLRRQMADRSDFDACRPQFAAAIEALKAGGHTLVDSADVISAEQLSDMRSSVFRTEFKAALNAFLSEHAHPCGMASLADIIAWNEAHPAAIPYGQSLLLSAQQSAGLSDPRYLSDRARDLALSSGAMQASMDALRLDVLIVPMGAAAKLTGKAGSPVIAIPYGSDSQGLPFGITVLARPLDDRHLLQVAQSIEDSLGQRILPWLSARAPTGVDATR